MHSRLPRRRAGGPRRPPAEVTQPPGVANGRRSLTSAGRNEDVPFKIPALPSLHVPAPECLQTRPAPRHHRVIRLYQLATLMTPSLTPDRSHANSFKFLKKS
ncbi:unnamed protein product [Pleuronectes platessa]|uniref:Uncharacterized protein n=1 Tax=Pleuronectes platessa TaxID=8262 RepID=A0A9N7Z7R7_PLEPL|nr:unnamed protein product [Pleuronectes platessa]